MNSGQWEPRPKYISPIMVDNMKHIDHGFIQQQQLKCKYNWNSLIGPIALHIDHVRKQDHGYDTRMLEILAACTKMMQNHHKALLVGPCLYEFKQHIAKVEPPQEYEFYTHSNQFRDFQKNSKVIAGSHCNYGMAGCWQPAFDFNLTVAVHIKVPAFERHNKRTIDQQHKTFGTHVLGWAKGMCMRPIVICTHLTKMVKENQIGSAT